MTDELNPSFGEAIDPQGNVTYDFAGHVHAQGLDLDASSLQDWPQPVDRVVRWLTSPGGVLVAELSAFQLTSTPLYNNVGMHVADGAGANAASVEVEAREAFADGKAVYAKAAGATVRVWDNQGKSSFVTWAFGTGQSSARAQHLATGATNVSYPGGTGLSNGAVVPHGLGVVPVLALAVANCVAVAPTFMFVIGLDAINVTFQAQAQAAPAIGTLQPFYWIAIG